MIAFGYCRVSTTRQAEEGVSLDAQRERITAWARQSGHELACIETDAGLSGGRSDNRPALLRAIEAVCEQGGVLVVYSLSRLARSTRDALEIAKRLHKSGANLVSLSESIDTTTAMGRFFFTVLAALAALERDLISERTKMALAHKRANGEHTGGEAPYGSRVVGGELATDEDEQRVIAIIRFLYQQGQNPSAIARRLNASQTPCHRGSAWHAKTIARILAAHKET
jgi:DNA invertase Pin-like site-specific DNA recombinase